MKSRLTRTKPGPALFSCCCSMCCFPGNFKQQHQQHTNDTSGRIRCDDAAGMLSLPPTRVLYGSDNTPSVCDQVCCDSRTYIPVSQSSIAL